jgi:GxxExxY protein
MPIETSTQIRALDQESFHALDRVVMRVVFDIHNEFGRLMDEILYKKEIAARWLATGGSAAEREVKIRVTHGSFRKDYSMDLLLNNCFMVEAKVAESIAAAHRAQGLNYLCLTGMQHARLVNLRTPRVQHEFLSTKLTHEKRRQFKPQDLGWKSVNAESDWFRRKVLELLADWGAFLEVTLYRDAITHLLGGEARVIQPVLVYSGERFVGEQAVHKLTHDTAFALTAFSRNQSLVEDHHLRFLRHTPLRFIQWINFNHHDIEFKTLQK